MKEVMDNYELMRLSEDNDDDAFDRTDFEEKKDSREEAYRAFYDDVKVSIKEDW